MAKHTGEANTHSGKHSGKYHGGHVNHRNNPNTPSAYGGGYTGGRAHQRMQTVEPIAASLGKTRARGEKRFSPNGLGAAHTETMPIIPPYENRFVPLPIYLSTAASEDLLSRVIDPAREEESLPPPPIVVTPPPVVPFMGKTPAEQTSESKKRRFPPFLIPPIIVLGALGIRQCDREKPAPEPSVSITTNRSSACSALNSKAFPADELAAREQFLNMADIVLGEQEQPGNKGPVVKSYMEASEGPWCTGFISTLLKEMNLMPFTPSVWDFMQKSKARGAWHGEKDFKAQPGDVFVVYSPDRNPKSHTRQVHCVHEDGSITFISGNSKDPVGSKNDSVRLETLSRNEMESLYSGRNNHVGFVDLGDLVRYKHKAQSAVR